MRCSVVRASCCTLMLGTASPPQAATPGQTHSPWVPSNPDSYRQMFAEPDYSPSLASDQLACASLSKTTAHSVSPLEFPLTTASTSIPAFNASSDAVHQGHLMGQNRLISSNAGNSGSRGSCTGVTTNVKSAKALSLPVPALKPAVEQHTPAIPRPQRRQLLTRSQLLAKHYRLGHSSCSSSDSDSSNSDSSMSGSWGVGGLFSLSGSMCAPAAEISMPVVPKPTQQKRITSRQLMAEHYRSAHSSCSNSSSSDKAEFDVTGFAPESQHEGLLPLPDTANSARQLISSLIYGEQVSCLASPPTLPAPSTASLAYATPASVVLHTPADYSSASDWVAPTSERPATPDGTTIAQLLAAQGIIPKMRALSPTEEPESPCCEPCCPCQEQPCSQPCLYRQHFPCPGI